MTGRLSMITLVLLCTACTAGGSGPDPAPVTDDGAEWQPGRLPTGAHLDPEGTRVTTGTLPLSMVLSPDGRYALLLLSGYRLQGVQVIDRSTNRVVQTMKQQAAFVGIAFSPDGRTLYTSGGNQDVIYIYDWDSDRAPTSLLARRDSIILAPADPPGRAQTGVSYPAGISVSQNGERLYVAENLYDSLAVVDIALRRVRQRLPAGRYPYSTAVGSEGNVYVTSWATDELLAYDASTDRGPLFAHGSIKVGRHPSAMLFNRNATRLFIASGSTDRIAVYDPETRTVVKQLDDAIPGGVGEGSTPNAFALSNDGTRLYVAEADNNALAIFDLSAATSRVASARGNDSVIGRIPVEWYPTAVATRGDTILVATGKGSGTRPNPRRAQPGTRATDTASFVLDQVAGSFMTIASPPAAALTGLSARVAKANGWNIRRDLRHAYPPFEHVIYVIKENRTYDQILGDVPLGDGDTSLVFFPKPVTPNHHALAERFGLFDRFFVNAEVSAQGHNWTVGAYTTDYLEKTVQSSYGSRGRSYDYEGTNRGVIASGDDDVASPANGYLWDLAQRAKLTFRNYGEYAVEDPRNRGRYIGTKPFLVPNTSPTFPTFNLNIPDQLRADVYLAEFEEMKRTSVMPQLTIIRLPSDHTSGGKVGAPTPRAHVADNDLALGRIIEAISTSRFWATTAIFILEDDAQDGPDHVDSHRSPLFVVSPYTKRGLHHRFANTTDVIRTMSEILGMGSLSQFDHFGRPLRDIWNTTPDLTPYRALTPSVALTEKNAAANPGARDSRRLDLDGEDESDDDLFNMILWKMMKPGRPYPGPTRMSVSEVLKAR